MLHDEFHCFAQPQGTIEEVIPPLEEMPMVPKIEFETVPIRFTYSE